MDALRGIAMWLGVVLHSVISYQKNPRAGWPLDNSSSIVMDFIYEYLHAFRMPLFFLVAGFFAHFLYKKIGMKPFIIHRAKRILVPFILSIIFVVPVCGYVFAIHRLLQDSYTGNIFVAAIEESLHWTGFYHIWFLYYLMILYGIMLVGEQVLNRIKAVPSLTEAGYFGSTIVLICIQFFFYQGQVEPWTGIVPKTGQILYYAYFFGLGYLIYLKPDFLFKHEKLRYCYLLVGVILIPVISYVQDSIPYWAYSILLSIQTNLLILGHIAVFMNIFKRESPIVRYFSDASYWFYLIHFPIVVGLQMLLMNFNISVWLKCFIVISTTTFFSIITYEYFVRYTWIGTILNGKKVRNSESLQLVGSRNK